MDAASATPPVAMLFVLYSLRLTQTTKLFVVFEIASQLYCSDDQKL
ncbi:hypothetical protein NIES2107_21640 [Nostoc carneum NIES-2107]|nr:hypothetical protein NIES2107_21640 [Nostoc carneum NIES-2107]